ncbi:MAG: alpha-amylase [Prevotella sp.]|nr:alpha-amylase [Prevotella sp.]
MKKTIISLSLAIMLLAACTPQKDARQTSFKLPATDDIAMYQVNPRVFAPSKSLNAVTARIDSIQALGVNMLWVMPIYPIGEEKTKNSPYCIRDYKAIAPEFGTLDDFKKLTQTCHEHGMGIIMDWVANHTAWDNPWVKEHKDWYTHDQKGEIIHPAGTDWTDVADLNYNNRDMRNAMIDAMLFWIRDMGVDGFRCDYADGVPADFWKEAIDTLRKAAGDRQIIMLAEGKRVDNFTVGGFQMNYGWDYKDSLVSVFCKGRSVEHLFAADKAEYDSLPQGRVKMRFTTNHDHASEISPVKQFTNERGSMAAYVATIFPHGGALIYGSQEVGYEDNINFFKYVPVNWMAHGDLYKEYQHLIKLYNDNTALRKGKMTPYPDKDIMLFEKKDDAGAFLVAINVRNEAHSMALPDAWKDMVALDVYSGKDYTLKDKIELKPFEYIILKTK